MTEAASSTSIATPRLAPLRLLYAAAIFLGSLSMFLVEPMAGKWLVPRLGGSAAVWTTCLVYFQSALLLGYVLAWWISTRLRPRAQMLAYGLLLLTGLAQTAALLHPDLHADTTRPIASTFRMLFALIGTPFLALSATNPLLQSWYARSASSGELAPPYRLFALSNAGSLLALVLYPTLIEPRFSLHVQTQLWLVAYLLLAVSCLGIMVRTRSLEDAPDASRPNEPMLARLAPRTYTHWLALSACGSLLLAAVTSHLSQNVAAIPLLWILPLIAYLLSFVVAFQGEHLYPRRSVLLLLALLLAAVGYLLHDDDAAPPVWLAHVVPNFSAPQFAVPFYCVALFIACLFCHAELYRSRPEPQHATAFYVATAAGGALGALFVGVFAPLVFDGNPELVYGLGLTAALALLASWRLGILWRAMFTGVFAAMLALAAVGVASGDGTTLFEARSFYGTLRVARDDAEDSNGTTRTLYHGTIVHGLQFDAPAMRRVATTYYSPDSGVALALRLCCANTAPRRIGVIGLGTGTLAAYGRPGDHFRFYEIDPLVERVARERFSYLADSRAHTEVVLGDARLSLAAEPAQHFDVLVVDAFSGDAIPVHLLTSEAMALYRRHLAPNGVLVVHVSNLYLDLAPLVRQQALHAGWQARLVATEDNDAKPWQYGSDWVVATANKQLLARPEFIAASTPIPVQAGLRLWTDDYNSLLPLLNAPTNVN